MAAGTIKTTRNTHPRSVFEDCCRSEAPKSTLYTPGMCLYAPQTHGFWDPQTGPVPRPAEPVKHYFFIEMHTFLSIFAIVKILQTYSKHEIPAGFSYKILVKTWILMLPGLALEHGLD